MKMQYFSLQFESFLVFADHIYERRGARMLSLYWIYDNRTYLVNCFRSPLGFVATIDLFPTFRVANLPSTCSNLCARKLSCFASIRSFSGPFRRRSVTTGKLFSSVHDFINRDKSSRFPTCHWEVKKSCADIGRLFSSMAKVFSYRFSSQVLYYSRIEQEKITLQ